MDKFTIVGGLSLALAWDWTTTLSLIFGGCCSNALTLEQLTSQNPYAGGLITFSQFLFITLHGLTKFVQFTPYPRLKPRQISILPHLIQVVLFYLVSTLNNAAFAYKIPMAVHIVFRSGGLIINMFMGWLLQQKTVRRYHRRQIISVFVVTAGVMLTTLSAVTPSPSNLKASQSTPPTDVRLYMTGIFILFVALLFSSLLGIAQDVTYTAYRKSAAGGPNAENPWQESMFYMHFLSMPMFLTMRHDLTNQFQALMLSPSVHISIPTVSQIPQLSNYSALPLDDYSSPYSIIIPSAILILLLNTITQLVCVAGVHRLTSRVTSLTVTLVLVVRKAVSLLISILLFGDRYDRMDLRSKVMMLSGAGLVFAGTLAYSLVPKKVQGATEGQKQAKED